MFSNRLTVADRGSTGWETFLDALIRSGFTISGTWPMRTELTGNLKKNVNALASSIVLVCRPRPADAAGASRREFLTALKRELPAALVHLQRGNIAPVDLAQVAIGPGMAVYTRFSRVLNAEGYALTVREALALINQALDEALEQSARLVVLQDTSPLLGRCLPVAGPAAHIEMKFLLQGDWAVSGRGHFNDPDKHPVDHHMRKRQRNLSV